MVNKQDEEWTKPNFNNELMEDNSYGYSTGARGKKDKEEMNFEKFEVQ